MKRYIFLFLCIVCFGPISGQNLVPNPSFESFTLCPGAQSQIGNAAPWDNPAASGTSSDYFNACNGSVGTACGNVSVPNNFCGNVPANTGDGYVGVIGYYTSCPNCREYVEAPLPAPLTAGVTYDIGFWVRPAELNRYVIDLIGMNIQIGPHAQPGNQPILLTPTLESGMVDDITGWTLVSGTYTAVGGENFVCLGVFHDNVDLNVVDLGASSSGCALANAGGHYLIDDVFINEPDSLVVSATTPICAGDSTTLVATPGSCLATTWFELGNPTPIGFCDTLIQFPAVTTTYVGVDTSGLADTVTVEVLNPPVVDLGPDQTICAGQTATFNAGVNPAVYNWSNGGSGQTITVSIEDDYWVEVTVGNCSASDTVHLFVDPGGTVDLGPDTTLCNGATMSLDAGAGADSYFWSNFQTGQAITVSNAGQYWVQAAFGSCFVSDTIIVSTENLQVNIPLNGLVCEGEAYDVDATTIGAISYLWSNGSDQPSTQLTTGGAQWVQVNSANCVASDTINILYVESFVELSFTDTLLCIGDSVSFDVTHPNAQSYLWSDGTNTATNVIDSAGTYWIQVANTLCLFRDTVTVFVSDPLASFVPSDTNFCAPGQVRLNDGSFANLSADPIVTWTYDLGDGSVISAQEPNHIYDEPGDYQVYLEVETANGCTDDTLHPFIISANEVPMAGFQYEPRTPDPINPIVYFEDISVNGFLYKYYFGDGNTSTDSDPSHLYSESGTYLVEQWVTSLEGCTDSVSFPIRIKDPYFIYVPSAFTPDNNGINEVFKAEGEGILEFNFEIYNRWGEMLWQTASIDNAWDGTHKGLLVAAGVYVYQINLTTVNLDPVDLYGKVVVLK